MLAAMRTTDKGGGWDGTPALDHRCGRPGPESKASAVDQLLRFPPKAFMGFGMFFIGLKPLPPARGGG